MRARCVRIVSPITGQTRAHAPYLTVGSEYTVIEMSVSGGAVTVRILDDQFKLPSIWPIDCFEMVQPRVPVNWALDVSEDLSLRFAPQAWLREGFWEDFFSDDPRALEDFRREVQVIGESD